MPEGTSFNLGETVPRKVCPSCSKIELVPGEGAVLVTGDDRRSWQTSCWEADEGTSVARGQGHIKPQAIWRVWWP